METERPSLPVLKQPSHAPRGAPLESFAGGDVVAFIAEPEAEVEAKERLAGGTAPAAMVPQITAMTALEMANLILDVWKAKEADTEDKKDQKPAH